MITTLNKNTKENLKTAILVVLVLLTMLLLYFFWGDFSASKLQQGGLKIFTKAGEPDKVIMPDTVVFSQGGKSYKIVDEGNWVEIIKAVSEFSASGSVAIEAVEKNQYYDAMESEAVKATFAYSMSLSDFCNIYDLRKPQNMDGTEALSEIGLTSISSTDILLCDRAKEKFYRIIGKTEEKAFGEIIKKIRDESAPACFTLSKYLGGNSKSSVLLPVAADMNLYDFSFKSENDIENAVDRENITEMAKTFFGNSFDFIRRIEEGNGTIIYMYGYGQKVFIANTDGSIEYKEVPGSGEGEGGFLGDLKTALEFIHTHGGFRTPYGPELKPYLAQVIMPGDRQKNTKFLLGIRVNGHKMQYEKGYPVVVEVAGGKVTYFYRNLPRFSSEEVEVMGKFYSEAYSPINMLAKNYEYFKKALGYTGSFEDVANQIKSVEEQYLGVFDSKKGGSARAVWAVKFIDGKEAFFDLYTADPVYPELKPEG